METYEIQGQSFTMKGNDLNLLNKAAPLIARWKRLSREYTKDIDLSGLDTYRDRINEKTIAIEQVTEILETGLIDDVPITDEQRDTRTKQLETLKSGVEAIENEYNSDTELKERVKDFNEQEAMALMELVTDIDFLLPIFKKIFTGGNFSAIKWDVQSLTFIKDVVTDFFLKCNVSGIKL